MANSIILCGGTGAHVGVAFLRLHTLGYAFGFFNQGDKPFDFPRFFLVDQDAGDRGEGPPTAWQLARRLVDLHPARYDWQAATGRAESPELVQVTPLPTGPNQRWYQPPTSSIATRFENSPLRSALTARRQQEIDYSKGMMGSPAVGSLLFKLKEYDERQRGINHDETFGQMLQLDGRIVVAGSGVGGTGSSVAPTLANTLARTGGARRQVMTVMVLNWFEFEEEGVDGLIRERAQLRNRIMQENANSALQFYGHSLSESVAAVPIGVPGRAILNRQYTSDMQQPVFDSFIHGVAALCSARHLLRDRPYGAGLYMMGAVDPGKLDGRTAIPGGSLQSLANQAETLVTTLRVWQRVLSAGQNGRVIPAIYEAVRKHAEPAQVAEHLGNEIQHFEEQLKWMKDTLGIHGALNRSFTVEGRSRLRLEEERQKLPIKSNSSPEEIASALFHWSAGWIRQEASANNGLVVGAARDVHGGYWPDLKGEGLVPSAEMAGELTRIKDANIGPTLQAFVNPDYLSCNGWPHPLAAADYFRQAIEGEDAAAFRQLELLLVGLVSGVLDLEEIPALRAETPVSLENLTLEFRRDHGFPGLAEVKIVYPRRNRMVVGFNSPHTLLCPVPFMDDEESNSLWNELWTTLSGASDGANWNKAAEPEQWRDYDLVVRQIKFWIEHQKRSHRASSPSWTKVFSGYPSGEGNIPFGAGRLLKVYWGRSSEVDVPLVDLNLPTRHTGIWVPPEGTHWIDEGELLELVPELRQLKDERGEILFEIIGFEVPGKPDEVRGVWDEHLDALVKEGKIFLWSPGDGAGVIIGLMRDGELQACKLEGTQLLDRSTVFIETCTPLLQDPVPNSMTREGEILYPDLPIKSDFLALVESAGDVLIESLKRGDKIPLAELRPTVRRDTQGRQVVKWNLSLRGRKRPLSVEIRLEADTAPHQAHWMVWPRFRSRTGAGWRAYYVYEYCTFRALHVDTLWLKAGVDADLGTVQRRLAPDPKAGAFAYPVNFEIQGESPAHNGGPPLALSLRDTRNGQEHGLYLVPLKVLSDTPVEVAMGVDFGTSHSVAAVKIGSKAAQTVELLPELETINASRALTLHISECWKDHAKASLEEVGILSLGSWLPTYTLKRGNGLLPSELLVIPLLDKQQPDKIKEWLPATIFTIPAMDISRSDLAEHVLTDFKWETSAIHYKGRERELRVHYLVMFLELVLADVIANHAGGFPEGRVNLTFTYPLRNTEQQVEAFVSSVKEVIKRCTRGLGISLALQNDIGIYDESRAARLSTDNFGEVALIGDLGGGTLDLFIAAKGRAGIQFEEVADSTRLGGNILLRKIANSPDGFLPDDGGWINHDAQGTETKLRVWMRSAGASRLFGTRAGERPQHEEMKLQGFRGPSESLRPRILLDRYFRLIVEYMARNLVAYLVGHWFPTAGKESYDRLKISIQLRGNGWRLRYQDESYTKTTQEVGKEVRILAEILWSKIPKNPYPFPKEDRYWESAERYSVGDPKAASIKNVVGQAMSFSEIKDKWYSHTLVDLEVMRSNNSSSIVGWHDRVPFDTGGSTHVEIHNISPSLNLSSTKNDKRVEISELEAELQGTVNRALKDEGVLDPDEAVLQAPVAPLVWEAVFDSRSFWPEEG